MKCKCGKLTENQKYCSRACSNKYREVVYSKERNEKIGKKHIGNLNSMWKGDKVKYIALHNWVKRNKPKPLLCECCKKQKPYDLANISGEYKRDINDFEWLCRSCHMKKDKRILNLKNQSEMFDNSLESKGLEALEITI